MPTDADHSPDTLTLRLLAEELSITRRRVPGDTVKVRTVTLEEDVRIDEPLTHERVDIKRIPIGREIDAPPPQRVDGDTTIVSVVEEVVVIQRRLILKEEVHIRRVQVIERHQETVKRREQSAVVTRNGVSEPS